MQKNAVSILGVSEVRWKGQGELRSGNYVVYYSGGERADISSLRVNQLLYCVSLKIYNKFANYFCELKFSGNTHQRP